MYDDHPFRRKEKARRLRNETPDQRRRRWQREEREYQHRLEAEERERMEQEERLWLEEEARLAARTPEEIAADEAYAEAEYQRYLADKAKQDERDERRRAARTDSFSTFGT